MGTVAVVMVVGRVAGGLAAAEVAAVMAVAVPAVVTVAVAAEEVEGAHSSHRSWYHTLLSVDHHIHSSDYNRIRSRQRTRRMHRRSHSHSSGCRMRSSRFRHDHHRLDHTSYRSIHPKWGSQESPTTQARVVRARCRRRPKVIARMTIRAQAAA